ncbi:glutathione S-transferase N-terminal domain-containing protein [Zavarzinia sp.]|uniref:glutathione S-transferase N-terminal domain-containing protein n=1 Tax=Zavarzinia sp. TaxID=2027920 RepID=UPI003564FDDF
MTETAALYGAPCSLYTAKVRCFFRKHGLPFREYFTSHPHYRAAVYPAVKNHRVPVVAFADGEILQDSAVILDALERRHPEVPRPAGALRVLELFFEAYADRALLKPAMHYRWNFPEANGAFIGGEFGRLLAFDRPPAEWLTIGRDLAARMAAYLPPLGITEETIPAIETCYLALLDRLNEVFGRQPYLLGDAPSRADYGFIGPLFAHLGRDPHPLRLMQQNAPMVFRWVERMNAAEISSPEFPDRTPGFAATEALSAVTRQAVAEFLPEMRATADAFAAWAAQNPDFPAGQPISPKGEDQPSFGRISFALGDATVHQASAGHSLWLLQRMQDAFAALDAEGQAAARGLFAAAGGEALLDLKLARRLARTGNKLALA